MTQQNKKNKNINGSLSPLQPLADRVVIKLLSFEEVKNKNSLGLIIPDSVSVKEKPSQGTVIAVGPGKWNEDGDKRVEMSVSVGDTVVFSKYGYDEVTVQGVLYYLISESQILAIHK